MLQHRQYEKKKTHLNIKTSHSTRTKYNYESENEHIMSSLKDFVQVPFRHIISAVLTQC